MGSITINTKNDKVFSANGYDTPKAYEAVLNCNKTIDIIPIHRDTKPLFINLKYSNITIDGSTPVSNTEALELLNAIVFKKGGATGEGVGKNNYQLWLEAGNTGSLADFLNSLKAKVIILTEDEYAALNGVHEQDVPYYVIEN